MRKLIFVFLILVFISPVFAQNESRYNTSDMYVINVSVDKIYPSGRGYLIQYRTGLGLSTVGIPNEWFSSAGGKAELVHLPRGRSWPSMSVFYRDGEFSHVRVYAHREKSHQTWGNIPQSADVSRFFSDSEDFKLRF